MSHYQHLLDQLKQLRLGGLLDTLEVRLKEAEKRQLAYVDFLTLLIQDELERRSQTKFARRLKKACFAEIKTLEEFDFGFNPNIKRRRIYDLATCRFLENKENICLCGLSNRFSVISFRSYREGLLHLFFPAGQIQVLPAG